MERRDVLGIQSADGWVKAREKDGNAVNLPEITYNLDKAFKSDASIPKIPKTPDAHD